MKPTKINLGWCALELQQGLVACHFPQDRVWRLTPAEAIQLADALRTLAESYVDPVEAKARELHSIFSNAGGCSYVDKVGDEPWAALARHVLAGEKRSNTEESK